MVDSMLLRRLRATGALVAKRVCLDKWFPHVPLALALLFGGFLLLDTNFAGHWIDYTQKLLTDSRSLEPSLLPPLLIGGGMVVMAIGLLFRSRLAWFITLLLVVVAIASTSMVDTSHQLSVYFVFILIVLFLFWRNFNRSSVMASTLFAFTAFGMLIGYGTFGSYYLGAEFDSPITSLTTAFYWSMVTMSTVGYGDISPITPEAQLFTSSVIILGITVFATALTAVIGPMVSHSLSRIVNNQGVKMKRENHFIVIGDTSLAANAAQALQKRGQKVTRLFRSEPAEVGEFDYAVGQPSNSDVLNEVGVKKAEAVLALTADDSENAFVVLSVKELAPKVETMVTVNDADNLDRIKLVHPDVLLTPQLLGGELAASLLSGDTLDSNTIMDNAFSRLNAKA